LAPGVSSKRGERRIKPLMAWGRRYIPLRKKEKGERKRKKKIFHNGKKRLRLKGDPRKRRSALGGKGGNEESASGCNFE